LQALALHALCLARGVPLIINDDLELALEIDAEGLHLGRDDASWAEARKRLGANSILGVSCYDDWALAETALAVGADYLAFGAAYASRVKPDAVRAPAALYARAKRELPVSVVAIGGIDAHNAGELAAIGVDAVAVISAVYGAGDVEAAARAIARHWQAAANPPSRP
jgi:thiamine-phosphate pyrophosphorylase